MPLPGSMSPSPTGLPPPRPGHLLCIDDNPVNGLLVQEFFRLRRGLPVRVAASGGEGLAMARNEPPMAVLLDLGLPDMSGLEVLRRLHADPLTAHLPVAIVSGSIDPDELARAYALGARAHWPKPLDLGRLEALLVELLGP